MFVVSSCSIHHMVMVERSKVDGHVVDRSWCPICDGKGS